MATNTARMMADPVLRHAETLTIGYLAGLRGEDPDPELSQVNSRYEQGWLLGYAEREKGVLAPKYLGYHATEDLPISQGQYVTILKGTPVRWNGQVKPAGRTYKVKVHHLMNGSNLYIEGNAFRESIRNIVAPTVVWPGSGGYWSEVDINLIPEAQ